MGSYERVNTEDEDDEEQTFDLKFGDIGLRGICRGAIITVSFVALCISIVAFSLSVDILVKRNELTSSSAMASGGLWPEPTAQEPTLSIEEIYDLLSTEAFPTDPSIVEVTRGTVESPMHSTSNQKPGDVFTEPSDTIRTATEEETSPVETVPTALEKTATTPSTTKPTTPSTTTTIPTTRTTTTTKPTTPRITTPEMTTQPPIIVYEYYDKLAQCEFKRLSSKIRFDEKPDDTSSDVFLPLSAEKVILSVKCTTYHGDDASLFEVTGSYMCMCAGKDYDLIALESASQSLLMHPEGFEDDLSVALETLYCYADFLECPV